MDLLEKNGQPSMEEILASIRRIIAEEPQGANPVIDLNARSAAARGDLDLEGGSDFELPSMFRPVTPSAPEKPTPLFGRLTDAIRGASASASAHNEAKTARSYETPVRNTDTSHLNGHSADEPVRAHPSLSSLNLSRVEHAAADRAHQAAPSAAVMPTVLNGSASGAAVHAADTHGDVYTASPSAPVNKIDEQMPRQMAAFMDTRFSRMTPAATDAPIAPTVLTSDLTVPRPADIGSIVPGQFESFASTPPQPTMSTLAPDPFPVATVLPTVETPYIPVIDFAPIQELPPPVYPQIGDVHPVASSVAQFEPPASKSESFAQGTIEDTTADLLRPMLRQWLADNMPRMVEKALHIEVAESVKTGKKFNGH